MRDEWDEEYDRRPRRRDRWDDDPPRWGDERDDYDDGAASRPEDRVRAPGTALVVVGIVGVVLTIAALAIALAVGLNNPPPEPELMFNIIFGAVFGALSIAYFAVMAVGGMKMRRCQGYGLAMTAAVLAIASIVLLGLCSVVIIPWGIWALVVLVNQDVSRAFRRRRDRTADSYD